MVEGTYLQLFLGGLEGRLGVDGPGVVHVSLGGKHHQLGPGAGVEER